MWFWKAAKIILYFINFRTAKPLSMKSLCWSDRFLYFPVISWLTVFMIWCSVVVKLVSSPSQVRDEANKAGVPPARESIWQYFVNKCANNLHIVLAMSPVGETLRTRCRNFPGLVNNCIIDWFTAWPQQALHAVASVFLGENVSFSLFWLTLSFHSASLCLLQGARFWKLLGQLE